MKFNNKFDIKRTSNPSKKSEKINLEQERIYFLKLFNRCLSENMGQESFRSLLNLARAKVAGKYLTRDPNIIGLIMKKTLKVRPHSNSVFLEELLYLLQY